MDTIKKQLGRLMLLARCWFYLTFATIFLSTSLVPAFILKTTDNASYQTYDLITEYSIKFHYLLTPSEIKKVVVIDELSQSQRKALSGNLI